MFFCVLYDTLTIIDKEIFDKAAGEIYKRASSMGRLNINVDRKAKTAKTSFHMKRTPKQRYKDPFRQAEYVYSLIESEKQNYSGKYALTGVVCCVHCDNNFRRIKRNNNGCKSTVWRCVSMVSKEYESCAARTVNEEWLHLLHSHWIKLQP